MKDDCVRDVLWGKRASGRGRVICITAGKLRVKVIAEATEYSDKWVD